MTIENEIESEPILLRRDEHNISRKDIDPDALKVMYRLIRHGFKAYLVGGGVRDLFLGKKPKDFDIGTDARPDVVRKIFRNSRIIGRRFKINHVYFLGNKIIEVTTFRALYDPPEEEDEVKPVASDNVYGDARSDALRRDLTINGLFYDLNTFSIIDYVGGIADLRQGVVRMIGEPNLRFREDPVRMIRAIRHAARTGFDIEPATFQAVGECASLIAMASLARLHEEIVRELRYGAAQRSFGLMADTGLLGHLFPTLVPLWGSHNKQFVGVLRRIDRSTAEGIPLPESVLLSLLFLPVIDDRMQEEFSIEDADIREELRLELERVLSSVDDEGPRRRRKKGPPAAVSELNRVINDLFVPLGVSKKVRAEMLAILEMRRVWQVGGFEFPEFRDLLEHPVASLTRAVVEMSDLFIDDEQSLPHFLIQPAAPSEQRRRFGPGGRPPGARPQGGPSPGGRGRPRRGRGRGRGRGGRGRPQGTPNDS